MTLCISEGLIGAIIGACLTFLFTILIESRKQHCGRTTVVLLNSTYILDKKGDMLENIIVYANVECTNTKLIPSSIYDWHAVIITDKGPYRIQMGNKKDNSHFDFMDVTYLNQNQSCIIPLQGKKFVGIEHFNLERGIKDITTIHHIDIFYRCNGSKYEKKAKTRQ